MDNDPGGKRPNTETTHAEVVHILPCKIDYVGSAPVSAYFNATRSGSNDDGKKTETASFRGRPLNGSEVPLRENGYRLYKASVAKSTENGKCDELSTFRITGEVERLMYWNLDQPTSHTADRLPRLMHYLNRLMRTSLMLWLLTVAPVWCELVSTGLAVGVSFSFAGFIAGFDYFKCKWYECCDDNWIPNNATSLKDSLQTRLYGQHLVIDTVVRAIRGHTSNKNPSKALVISFHGWTGGGKNYVSSMIAQNLYKKGMQSQYVHLFIAKLHFPHASEINRDKANLQSWIRGNVSRCGRNLFIFDELDEMNSEILEAVKPFIDYHAEVDGVDYRRTIFIFISNTGGNDISQKALKHWRAGNDRESLTLAEMEKVIHVAAYNEPGGLKFSQLISSNLIDHFVPFLPLELQHVKLCIRDHFRWRGIDDPSDDWIHRVAAMLQYFPKEDQVYSSSGCKRVSQKVNLLLEEAADDWSLQIGHKNEEL